MKKEIIDFSQALGVIAKKTNRKKMDICHQVGIGGGLCKSVSFGNNAPELKHSEGEALIAMYREVTDDDLPIKKLTETVCCPSCNHHIDRNEVVRIKHSVFRCIECDRRAK